MNTTPNERTGRSQHRQEISSRQRNGFQENHGRRYRQRAIKVRDPRLGTERSARRARKKGSKPRRSEAPVSKLETNSISPEPYIPRQRTNSPPFDLTVPSRSTQEKPPDSDNHQVPFQSYTRTRPRKSSRTGILQSQTPSQDSNSDVSYPEKSHIPPLKPIVSKPRPLREFGSENDIKHEDRRFYSSERLDSGKFASPGYCISDINAPPWSSSTRLIEPIPLPLNIHQNVSAISFEETHGTSIDINSAIHDREEFVASRSTMGGAKSTEPKIELKHPGTLVDFGRNSSLSRISTISRASRDIDIAQDPVPVGPVMNSIIRQSTPIPIQNPSPNSLTTILNSLERSPQWSDDISLNASIGASDPDIASDSPVRHDSGVISPTLLRNNVPHVSMVSSSPMNARIGDRLRADSQSSPTNLNTTYTSEEVINYHSSSSSSSESVASKPYYRSLGSPVASDTSSVISMAGYLLGAGILGRESRDRFEFNDLDSVYRPVASSIESVEVGKIGTRFVPTSMSSSSTLGYDVICASPSLDETTVRDNNQITSSRLPRNIGSEAVSLSRTPMLVGLRDTNTVGITYGSPQNSSGSASNGNSQGRRGNHVSTSEVTIHYHPGKSSASTVSRGSHVSNSRSQTFIPPVTITQNPKNIAASRIVNPLPERIDTKSIRRRGVKTEETQRMRGSGHEFRGMQRAEQVHIANFPMGQLKYRATVESVVDSEDETNRPHFIEDQG
jgi:hypothetical protein